MKAKRSKAISFGISPAKYKSMVSNTLSSATPPTTMSSVGMCEKALSCQHPFLFHVFYDVFYYVCPTERV